MRCRSDRGAAAVEAGLLIAGLGAAVLGAVFLLGGRLEGFFTAAIEAISGT